MLKDFGQTAVKASKWARWRNFGANGNGTHIYRTFVVILLKGTMPSKHLEACDAFRETLTEGPQHRGQALRIGEREVAGRGNKS